MFKQKKTKWGIILFLALALIICGCTQPATPTPPEEPDNQEEEAADGPYSIGIVQIVEHLALDTARAAFLDALASEGFKEGDNLTVDYKNAQGEMATAVTISEGFAAEGVDLILAIATPAAQAAATATKEIPILITAVTDPVEAGVVESMERPNTNVTGTTDMNPIKEQLELALEIKPDIKNIGVIYNSGEVNSVVQADIAKAAAPELGVNIVDAIATNSSEVASAAESLIGKVEAIYVPTDNTIVSALRSVIRVAEDHKLVLIAGDVESVENGAVATLGLSYYGLGYQTGLMAADVLRGADPATMPIVGSKEFTYAINKTAAQNMGVELPQSLIDRADEVFE